MKVIVLLLVANWINLHRGMREVIFLCVISNYLSSCMLSACWGETGLVSGRYACLGAQTVQGAAKMNGKAYTFSQPALVLPSVHLG